MKFIPTWLKNKYLLTLMGFALWMLFFDRNDIFTQLDRRKELKEIEQSTLYYTTEIKKNKQALIDLKNNPTALEKLAREKYFMKRDNEDIYIIEDNIKN